MTSGTHELRRAYEVAKALERGYRERYFPVKVLGGTEPEPVTPEVLLEFERLEAVTEAARLAWQAALRESRQ